MNKIIVIVGPTGVGKTKLSIELAKKYNGEIINADAMQIYKGLDIGTAKIKNNEKENIPHHLFDIKDVIEEYSVYHYQNDCRIKIKEIFSRNKTPILVGGTGLYIKAALYNYEFNELEKDTSLYDGVPTDDLYEQLILMDKDSIDKIDSKNRRRIINAIIYYKKNNKSITKNRTDELLYDSVFIGLSTNRDNLYNIINKRVDIMIEDGLIEEAKVFYENGIFTKPLLSGIGYKELFEYFDNKISLDEAIEAIKRNSRRYAKRQYTFFNNQLFVKWIETNYEDFQITVRNAIQYIDMTK